MKVMRKCSVLKVAVLILAGAFVTCELSVPFFRGGAESHALSGQSVFQGRMFSEGGQEFKESVLLDANLIYSALCIGEYLLGDPQKQLKPLPAEHLESVMKSELGAAIGGIDISNIQVGEGIVSIPCRADDRQFTIRISLKGQVVDADRSVQLFGSYNMEVFLTYDAGNAPVAEVGPGVTFTIDENILPGSLKDIVEKRFQEIEVALRPDGKPVFAEGYIKSDRSIDREDITLSAIPELGIRDGVRLKLSFAPWRESYKKKAHGYVEPYAVDESHRPTKDDKPCIFCGLPDEEILFNARLNERDYMVAVNINPFGDNHIMLIAKDPVKQDLSNRTKDVALFLKALGPEYEAIFNSPGAAASILHFHAQITKGRAPLRDNIESGLVDRSGMVVKDNVEEALLGGWLAEAKELRSPDMDSLSKQVDRDIAVLKNSGCPYNLLLFLDEDGAYTAYVLSGGNEMPEEMAEVDDTGTVKLGGKEMTGEVIVPNSEVREKMKNDPELLAEAIYAGSRRGILSTGVTLEDIKQAVKVAEKKYAFGGEYKMVLLYWGQEILRRSKAGDRILNRDIYEGLMTEFIKDPVGGLREVVPVLQEELNDYQRSLEHYRRIRIDKWAPGAAPSSEEIEAESCVNNLRQDLADIVCVLEDTGYAVRESERINEEDAARGIVSATIVLARQAKREGRDLVLGLETDWIPGYQKGALQHNAIDGLIKQIESLGDDLRSMGMDNVKIVSKKKDELLDNWADRIEAELDEAGDFSNIIILGSTETIGSFDNNKLGNIENDKRAFLAGVDAGKLQQFYAENGEAWDKQVNIEIMEMLLIALELAVGKGDPVSPIIADLDRVRRIVIFRPKAEPLDIQELQKRYESQVSALKAA